MNKKQIRLTESDLHRIVKESVKRVLRENANDYDYYFSIPNYDYDSDEPWEDTFGVNETMNGLEIYDSSNNLVCRLKGKRLSDYKTRPNQARVDMSNINDEALISDMMGAENNKSFDVITLNNGRKVKYRTVMDTNGNEVMVTSESVESIIEPGSRDDELFYCYIEDKIFNNYTDRKLQEYFEEFFD